VGLGLAICKELVTLMGGDIGFDARREIGASFWFTVPLKPVEEPGTVRPPNYAGHVLLVEDNRVNQRLALALLGRMGLTVDLAQDGVEAVERIATGAYDLVLMDCQMPRMDGFEATQIIRAREGAAGSPRRLPIIAVTASALAGDEERCISAGMDDYLAKPIRSEALSRKLRHWLPPA
jgi:CheY-like chemotaxis protein